MKATIFLSLLFLEACGTGEAYQECDYVHENICFQMNGFNELDYNMISFTLDSLEHNMQVYYEDFNIRDMLLNLETQLIVAYKKPSFFSGNIRAFTRILPDGFRKIYIGYVTLEDAKSHEEWPEESKTNKAICINNYYLLQHELLHIIAYDYVGVSGEENYKHEADNLFLYYGNKNSIESYSYNDICKQCSLLFND